MNNEKQCKQSHNFTIIKTKRRSGIGKHVMKKNSTGAKTFAHHN